MGVRSTGSHPTTTKADGHLLKYFRSDMGAGGGANAGPSEPFFQATGGTKIPAGVAGDGYVYHVYVSDGTFVQDDPSSQDGQLNVLIVAGGGAGGGRYYSGGGGAGGVVESGGVFFTGSANIVVGPGGPAVVEAARGTAGTDSSFNGVTAKGGGGGGSYSTNGVGGPGGSSGGSSGYHIANSDRIAAVSQPVPGDYTAYGNAGGRGADPQGYGGGGGGGAGAVGYDGGNPNGPPARGADGGAGRAFSAFPAPVIAPAIPSPVRSAWTTAVGSTGLFAGGGGGANYYTTAGQPSGGSGGGGQGGSADTGSTPTQTAGTNYTGSGGGGSNYSGSGMAGGNGIVIIKYIA
jgi:hypothetical protein